MTPPIVPNVNAAGQSLRQRRRRRWIALAAVLTLIVVAALLTPEMVTGRGGDSRLTTYSAEAQGARLLYELGSRLGWHVVRWTTDGMVEAGPGTVVAVLDPAQPLGALEAHHLLERVRAGAGLLYVMSGHSALDDSLHLKLGLSGGIYEPTDAGTAEAPDGNTATDTLRARRYAHSASDSRKADDEEPSTSDACSNTAPNGGALALWPDQTVRLYRLAWSGPRPPRTVIFARSAPEGRRSDSTSKTSSVAAAGYPEGRGRVVVISDPDLLRNDVLRVCRWGIDVVAVRMLEYVAAGLPHRDSLVFDEYHQGFGAHPGTVRAIFGYLSRAASGHMLLQALLGGLVLLLALGPRTLPARNVERIERRSPLEHVTALAQAYSRVGATRTATSRLLRGVRRRVERSVRGDARLTATEGDARFLEEAAKVPGLADEVALIRRALSDPLGKRDFEAVGGALERIEESLLTQRR
ncbi:MAG TPA: DUF4350 domain-containing protein [Gemmatimonadaceae bacterium]